RHLRAGEPPFDRPPACRAGARAHRGDDRAGGFHHGGDPAAALESDEQYSVIRECRNACSDEYRKPVAGNSRREWLAKTCRLQEPIPDFLSRLSPRQEGRERL